MAAGSDNITEDVLLQIDSNSDETELSKETESLTPNQNVEPTEETVHVTETAKQVTSNCEPKLFVGGLSCVTTEKELYDYFGRYGEIVSVHLKMDPQTGRSRGFAFIVFKSSDVLDQILNAGDHVINGKKIDPKKAKSRPGKIFVGGLSPETTEETIRTFFASFGTIGEIEFPFDRVKNQRKNFCFVTFDNDNVVKELLKSRRQVIDGKHVDIKKATPKGDSPVQADPRGSVGPRAPFPGPRGRDAWAPRWVEQPVYFDDFSYGPYGEGYGYYCPPQPGYMNHYAEAGYAPVYGGAGQFNGGKQRVARQPRYHQPY